MKVQNQFFRICGPRWSRIHPMFLLFWYAPLSLSYDLKCKGKFCGLKKSISRVFRVGWCDFAEFQGLAKQSRVVSSKVINPHVNITIHHILVTFPHVYVRRSPVYNRRRGESPPSPYGRYGYPSPPPPRDRDRQLQDRSPPPNPYSSYDDRDRSGP